LTVKIPQKFKLYLLGFIAGLASASLGIGGGVIVVPMLIIFFGYDIKKVLGTSLATAVPVVFVGILAHYIINAGNIRIFAALYIIVGALIGARLGATLANKTNGKNLKLLFALLLLLAGLNMSGVLPDPTNPILGIAVSPLLIILGVFSGLASAFFGIGGGIVTVPALHLFFGFPLHEAIPTSLVVILPTAFFGAVFHGKFSNINRAAVKLLIPAAFLGAVSGAIVENNVPEQPLKIVFGVFLLFCAAVLFTVQMREGRPGTK